MSEIIDTESTIFIIGGIEFSLKRNLRYEMLMLELEAEISEKFPQALEAGVSYEPDKKSEVEFSRMVITTLSKIFKVGEDFILDSLESYTELIEIFTKVRDIGKRITEEKTDENFQIKEEKNSGEIISEKSG